MHNQDITPKLFVESMLSHVPFDGWSVAAMGRTAEELGLSDSDVTNLFPDGLVGAITIGSNTVDTEMVAQFKSRFGTEVDRMAVHIKIRELLVIRFEILQTHKEAVRKMVAFMMNPAQSKLNSRLVCNTLDRIWRAAGDRSTDFNFYTKRATLGVVYMSTMLAFLNDDTADMQKTRAFLNRRLEDVAKFPKATKPLRFVVNMVGSMTNQIFTKKQK